MNSTLAWQPKPWPLPGTYILPNHLVRGVRTLASRRGSAPSRPTADTPDMPGYDIYDSDSPPGAKLGKEPYRRSRSKPAADTCHQTLPYNLYGMLSSTPNTRPQAFSAAAPAAWLGHTLVLQHGPCNPYLLNPYATIRIQCTAISWPKRRHVVLQPAALPGTLAR